MVFHVKRKMTKKVFGNKKFEHPYTEGLLKSIPKLNETVNRLEQIDGSVPNPLNLPKGCRFVTRCKYATNKCHECMPELVEVEKDHLVRCFYPEVDHHNE